MKNKFSGISRRIILWIIIGLLIIILVSLFLKNPVSASQTAKTAFGGSGMVGGC